MIERDSKFILFTYVKSFWKTKTSIPIERGSHNSVTVTIITPSVNIPFFLHTLLFFIMLRCGIRP